nr:elongation factor P hydroxylase [Gayadomonas joobiniege]
MRYSQPKHQIKDIINIFNQSFASSYNTRLISGDDEPIYLPACAQVPYHRIIFAHGYYASALHEIAHWCVAGPERRLKEDYGYWYAADGRNESQQAKFEQVEVKPQALEWILSSAADFKFNVSCDNLNGCFEPDRQAFKNKVLVQVKQTIKAGLSSRMQTLVNELSEFYQVPSPLCLTRFY